MSFYGNPKPDEGSGGCSGGSSNQQTRDRIVDIAYVEITTPHGVKLEYQRHTPIPSSQNQFQRQLPPSHQPQRRTSSDYRSMMEGSNSNTGGDNSNINSDSSDFSWARRQHIRDLIRANPSEGQDLIRAFERASLAYTTSTSSSRNAARPPPSGCPTQEAMNTAALWSEFPAAEFGAASWRGGRGCGRGSFSTVGRSNSTYDRYTSRTGGGDVHPAFDSSRRGDRR